MFVGVQKHVLFTGIGALFGRTADSWRNEYLAERDAVLRHYIELHPEDFPTPGMFHNNLKQMNETH